MTAATLKFPSRVVKWSFGRLTTGTSRPQNGGYAYVEEVSSVGVTFRIPNTSKRDEGAFSSVFVSWGSFDFQTYDKTALPPPTQNCDFILARLACLDVKSFGELRKPAANAYKKELFEFLRDFGSVDDVEMIARAIYNGMRRSRRADLMIDKGRVALRLGRDLATFFTYSSDKRLQQVAERLVRVDLEWPRKQALVDIWCTNKELISFSLALTLAKAIVQNEKPATVLRWAACKTAPTYWREALSLALFFSSGEQLSAQKKRDLLRPVAAEFKTLKDWTTRGSRDAGKSFGCTATEFWNQYIYPAAQPRARKNRGGASRIGTLTIKPRPQAKARGTN